VVGGERANSLITGAGKGLTSGAGLTEREQMRGKVQEWLTCGAGLAVGAARARAGGGPSWASGGGDERAGERERGSLGRNRPNRGRGIRLSFPFLFLFPNLFLLLLFYNLFFL
jgi:hypothetical protein